MDLPITALIANYMKTLDPLVYRLARVDPSVLRLVACVKNRRKVREIFSIANVILFILNLTLLLFGKLGSCGFVEARALNTWGENNASKVVFLLTPST